MKTAAILAAAALAVTLAGCNTSGCLDNQSSVPLAGFYDAEGRAVSIDSLAVYGVGAPGDSILYYGDGPLSEAYLPLRAAATRVQWCLRYMQAALDRPALIDTLTFTYRAVTYFASEQCGAMYRYHVSSLAHTSHLIDSVALADSVITNVPSQQIKIYFRTSQGAPDL